MNRSSLPCVTTACTALRPDPRRSGINWLPHTSGIQPPAASQSVGEPRVAICLLPGTEIVFEREVERQLTGFQLFFRRTAPLRDQVARFRQVNIDNPCTHHDALEFPDGQIVLLTHLRAGQRATVLQLPAQPKTADAAQSQTQAEAQSSGADRQRRWQAAYG